MPSSYPFARLLLFLSLRLPPSTPSPRSPSLGGGLYQAVAGGGLAGGGEAARRGSAAAGGRGEEAAGVWAEGEAENLAGARAVVRHGRRRRRGGWRQWWRGVRPRSRQQQRRPRTPRHGGRVDDVMDNFFRMCCKCVVLLYILLDGFSNLWVINFVVEYVNCHGYRYHISNSN